MRGLVLAAGRGSRLGPFTTDRPKCLVELAGSTLLERQVAALRAAGAREVGVATGWHSEAVQATGLPTFHNPRWASTTMVGSLATAREWLLDEPLLAGYGDIIYGAATASSLAAQDAPLAIAYDPDWESLWRKRFSRPLDDAETFALGDDGLVLDIGGKPRTVQDVRGQYIGLVRWTPQAWSVVESAGVDPALDMTGLLRHLVTERLVPVTAVPVADPWCEFDHPSDLEVGLDIARALDAIAVRAS
jgi:L-glutamine-phosphate cytidylyltransferase